LSERLLGDTVYANVLMLGYAWQAGLVPVSLEALMKAVELNGVAIDANRTAFNWGRIALARPDLLPSEADLQPVVETLDGLIARREAFLAGYQNKAYAERYRVLVDRVRKRETELGTEGITEAVARSLFKLMAYKDEYEVARLHAAPSFRRELEETFEGDFRVSYHLAPPLIGSESDWRGRPKKRTFGPWMLQAFRILAALKPLRGTLFDPFGQTAERRMERDLVAWYRETVERCLRDLDTTGQNSWREILSLPMRIRGYGPVKQEAVARIRSETARQLSQIEAAGKQPAEAASRELHDV
jgi:indolepyruvate ferredoxin oxidoreductase